MKQEGRMSEAGHVPVMLAEALEYLAPRDGRPFPRDTRSSDLWHWQTSFAAQKADDLSTILRQNRFDFISSGTVGFSRNILGFENALLVRDVDGHAVRIVDKSGE